MPLIPVTELSPELLGARIHAVVNTDDQRRLLTSRYALGVLARHTQSIEDSVESMRRAQRLHRAGRTGIYAVADAREEVTGMATIYPHLPLSRLSRHMRPIFARGPFRETYDPELYRTNISAWAQNPRGQDDKQFYSDTYRQLIQKCAEGEIVPDALGVWTIEPMESPGEIMTAIQQAGMLPTEVGIFDINEDRHQPPPDSKLFIAKDSVAAAA